MVNELSVKAEAGEVMFECRVLHPLLSEPLISNTHIPVVGR